MFEVLNKKVGVIKSCSSSGDHGYLHATWWHSIQHLLEYCGKSKDGCLPLLMVDWLMVHEAKADNDQSGCGSSSGDNRHLHTISWPSMQQFCWYCSKHQKCQPVSGARGTVGESQRSLQVHPPGSMNNSESDHITGHCRCSRFFSNISFDCLLYHWTPKPGLFKKQTYRVAVLKLQMQKNVLLYRPSYDKSQ